MAKLFLSAPATEAKCERYFKNASFTEEGRPNFTAETLSRVTRVRDAIKSKQYSEVEVMSKLTSLLDRKKDPNTQSKNTHSFV